MPSILKATAKALSKLAGPLGWPIDFVLSLVEDSRVEEREKKLEAALAEGQVLTEELLEQVVDVREEFNYFGRQLSSALQSTLAVFKLDSSSFSGEQALLEAIEGELRNHKLELEKNGLLTREVLQRSIVSVYRVFPGRFLRVITNAGFPVEDVIPITQPFGEVAFYFIQRSESRTLAENLKVFKALSTDSPGSAALIAAVQILELQLRAENLV